MLKSDNVYKQILQNLSVCGTAIPQVPLNGEFRYLGKQFGFDMKPAKMQKLLEEKLGRLLTITSKLKVSVQSKLKIFSQYIQNQLLTELKLYDFSETWVEQTLDSLATRTIRDWLELPISACVAEMVMLPRRQGGLGISSFKLLAEKMRLIKRRVLWLSKDDELKQIAHNTAAKNCKIDEVIAASKTLQNAKDSLVKTFQTKAADHLASLQCQGASLRSIEVNIPAKNILSWSKMSDYLPSFKYIFARKALTQVLPTAANLVRWKRSTDPNCPLCNTGVPQTNKHVLSNCSAPIALERYTKRHDEILNILVSWLKTALPTSSKLYADLVKSDCLPVTDLFNSCRPDIVICSNGVLNVLELTVCHETNLESSKNYKKNKYANIARVCSYPAKDIKMFTCEVSCLGFIAELGDFCKACKIPNIPLAIQNSIANSALSSSYKIYCNRNCSN
jgi:hypothetical protein